MADRYGQVWTGADKSGSWVSSVEGQVRTAENKSGSLVSTIVGRYLADRCGQVRTGADNSGFWLSFLGRTFGGQVRTGADRCGQVCFLGVSFRWWILGRHLGDSWISDGHLYHFWT